MELKQKNLDEAQLHMEWTWIKDSKHQFFWHILSNLMFLFSQIQIGWIGDSDRDAPTVGSSKNIQRYQPQKVDVGWLIGINSGLMCD